MITELTDSQLDKLKEYRDKWIEIGLSTTPVTLERAIEIIHPLQTELLGRKATPVVVMDNPLHAWIAVCWLANTNLDQVWDQVWGQAGCQVMSQVHDQVREQVREQVHDYVQHQVGDQVADQVRRQVKGQVYYQVRDQVQHQIQQQVQDQIGDQIWEQVDNYVRNQVWDQVYGRVRRQVMGEVGSHMREQVYHQVKGQVYDRVWNQVMDQVGDQVGVQIRDQVRAQVRDQVYKKVRDQVRRQVHDQVGIQVHHQVWDQVRKQVGVKVQHQVGDKVRKQADKARSQVTNQVSRHVWEQVREHVLDKMKEQVREQVKNFVWPWIVGQWEASSFSFYEFFLSETQVEIPDELRRKFEIWKATSELGIIYPLEHVAVVCQKPKAIHKNEYGLHREGGMALEYEGWGIYSLNGVRVPEYLAVTPSEELDINWYHSQENADVKAEFVRKYGVERMLSLGKKIDSYENYDEEWWTKSEYELWDMAALFPNLDYQPYLKMMNQTTKIWHVEAVSPNCRTLRDAIRERFGGRDFTIKAIA